MNIPELSSLEGFHRFIGDQLRSDAAAKMSPEQALALWRDRQETVQAIGEGLADMEAGRSKSFDQFRQDFASRHGIVGE